MVCRAGCCLILWFCHRVSFVIFLGSCLGLTFPMAVVSCFGNGAHEHATRPRDVAGNPYSPQAIVFLTSIIDVMVGY